MYYFSLFLLSATAFVAAIFEGDSVEHYDDLSQKDTYLKKIKIKTWIAATITIVAILLAAVPIVDSMTFHNIQVEKTEHSYTYTETIYESEILKIRCAYSYDEPSTWYIWILLIAEVVYLLTRIGSPEKKANEIELRIIKKQNEEAKRIENEKQAQAAETQAIQFVTSNYGKPDKIIHTTKQNPPDWSHAVFFVFDKEMLYYNEHAIKFIDIIDCRFVDNSTVKTTQTGNAITQRTTDTGSMVGRAIVGGVLAGGAGAVIGGATASQTGKTQINTTSVSVTKHDYTILINTKDIRNPLIKISCGDLEQAVNEIVATIKAGMSR